MKDGFDAEGEGGGEAPTSSTGRKLPGCQPIFIMSLMILVMGLLATILWQRFRQIDPARRCADAYLSSYSVIDTTLVDRIKVRTIDGDGRTTCGALRSNGEIDGLPPREVRRPFDSP